MRTSLPVSDATARDTRRADSLGSSRGACRCTRCSEMDEVFSPARGLGAARAAPPARFQHDFAGMPVHTDARPPAGRDQQAPSQASHDEPPLPTATAPSPAPAAGGTGTGAAPSVGAAAAGRGTGASLPTVRLGHFRNSGNTDGENNCTLCPLTLGVSATAGTNGMEIRGDISGHVGGAQYDFKRTKERATWKKVGSTWTQLTHVGPGANDDAHNDDEDLTPQNDHIFVIDTPGFGSATSNPTGDASATEGVYKASFTESCNVKVGSGAWTRSSNTLDWHSISWLEKSGGSWRRKTGSSEIDTGSTTVGTGNP